ncbi:MAG: hypothetical protein ACLFUU_10775 [Desulfobacteraceae bacterium]
MNDDCPKLIGLSPPAIPMWAVYCACNGDDIKLWTIPVVTLAVIEVEDCDLWFTNIKPITFDSSEGVDWWWGDECENLLGYIYESLDEAELRFRFSKEIKRYKEEIQKREAKAKAANEYATKPKGR